MDASNTSSSRVARAANAYRAPAAAALTRPGGSSAFAAAAVLGGNHRIVGVGAPSTCFAAAAHPAHPAAFSAASADEGQGLMSRMYAVAMGSRQAVAGGAAGIIARTASAPLDRIKLLFQVQAMEGAGTSATAYTGVGQAFLKIYREEGILSFWKGNGVNVIRVAPYAAAQLSSNDV